MNMANVFPPFKIDIAGAFCVPRALKDVREQYQNGQVSRQILQAVEDAEVRSLVERLELGGMKVVSDGGFRSREFFGKLGGYLFQRRPAFLRRLSFGDYRTAQFATASYSGRIRIS